MQRHQEIDQLLEWAKIDKRTFLKMMGIGKSKAKFEEHVAIIKELASKELYSLLVAYTIKATTSEVLKEILESFLLQKFTDNWDSNKVIPTVNDFISLLDERVEMRKKHNMLEKQVPQDFLEFSEGRENLLSL